jgi:pantothenate kinase-related protein Tda10
MLGPIIQAWLNSKLNAVKDLFEKEITGNIIRVAEDTFTSSGALIQRIDAEIARCRKGMTS